MVHRATAQVSSPIGQASTEIASPLASEPYKRPPGLSLLFCSRAEIEAADPVERAAYYRIVEGICEQPEAFGFKHDDDQWRRKNGRLSGDEFDHNQFSDENGDGEIYG
jgi:hypothetical protein